eukprot:bmy_05387T0
MGLPRQCSPGSGEGMIQSPANYLKFIYNKYLEKGAEDSSLDLASEAPTLESKSLTVTFGAYSPGAGHCLGHVERQHGDSRDELKLSPRACGSRRCHMFTQLCPSP